jgi:hypothetical protein
MYMYKIFSHIWSQKITCDFLWTLRHGHLLTWRHGCPSHISRGQKHPCLHDTSSQLITTQVHNSPPHWLPSHLLYFFICLIPFSHPLENPKACAFPLSPPQNSSRRCRHRVNWEPPRLPHPRCDLVATGSRDAFYHATSGMSHRWLLSFSSLAFAFPF